MFSTVVQAIGQHDGTPSFVVVLWVKPFAVVLARVEGTGVALVRVATTDFVEAGEFAVSSQLTQVRLELRCGWTEHGVTGIDGLVFEKLDGHWITRRVTHWFVEAFLRSRAENVRLRSLSTSTAEYQINAVSTEICRRDADDKAIS